MKQIRCDFHIHSALSPCADKDMTPGNIVAMAKLKGLDAIAITDHQSCGNVQSAIILAHQFGITVIPGMELETIEEIHSICLFPDTQSATIFEKIVRERLPGIDNREDIFGEQQLFDKNDEKIGKEKILLLASCTLTFSEAQKQVHELGGIMYPAHIDRDSYSILTVLGEIPQEYTGLALEISANCNLDELLQRHPHINDFKLIQSSDAHLLEDILEPGFLLEIDDFGKAGAIDNLDNLEDIEDHEDIEDLENIEEKVRLTQSIIKALRG